MKCPTYSQNTEWFPLIIFAIIFLIPVHDLQAQSDSLNTRRININMRGTYKSKYNQLLLNPQIEFEGKKFTHAIGPFYEKYFYTAHTLFISSAGIRDTFNLFKVNMYGLFYTVKLRLFSFFNNSFTFSLEGDVSPYFVNTTYSNETGIYDYEDILAFEILLGPLLNYRIDDKTNIQFCWILGWGNGFLAQGEKTKPTYYYHQANRLNSFYELLPLLTINYNLK